MTMIMMAENLATKITINNLLIPLCRHYETRKDPKNMGNVLAKIVKKSIFSKIKLTSLLVKKRASFPSKNWPVF